MKGKGFFQSRPFVLNPEFTAKTGQDKVAHTRPKTKEPLIVESPVKGVQIRESLHRYVALTNMVLPRKPGQQ
jgi:hypothetical protein